MKVCPDLITLVTMVIIFHGLDICNPDGLFSQRPKRFGDGSIGVIHVQEQECSELANPMQRHFLDDLERQKDQRIGLNRWLKEEKNVDFEKMKRECQKLVKEITMKGHDSDVKKVCKELAQKEKSEKAKMKKMIKKCKKFAEKEKCRKLAEKEKCRKKAQKSQKSKTPQKDNRKKK